MTHEFIRYLLSKGWVILPVNIRNLFTTSSRLKEFDKGGTPCFKGCRDDTSNTSAYHTMVIGVTMHGWGFNLNSDLNYFNNIIPCGIQDKAITSLNKELGREVDMEEIKGKLKRNFETLFEARLVIDSETHKIHD